MHREICYVSNVVKCVYIAKTLANSDTNKLKLTTEFIASNRNWQAIQHLLK